MLPTVEIAQSCLAAVEEELSRVAPREGLAVPLLWLERRDPSPPPTSTLRLADIARVVIADVLRVPPERQLNSGFRVGVLAQTDALLAEAVRARVRRHPRLRACAYLHSHPFARGGTWPSRGPGCDYEGHMLPLLERGLQAGLATCFSVIASRSPVDDRWLLQTFALDERGRIEDLGFAAPVPDSHPDVRRALLPALSRRRPFRLVRAWRSALRRAGVPHRVDELFDGWLRVIAGGERSLVALVPPVFPAEPARLFAWDRASGSVEPLPSQPLDRASALRRLVRGLEEEVHRERSSRLLPESASADRGGAQP